MKKFWKATHQHKKGGLYRVICDSVMSSEDLSLHVVYDDASGKVWLRPKSEFEDGRFIEIKKENV